MAGEIKPLRLKRQSAPKPKPSQAASQPVAKVLVDSGLLHIDQEFDFLVPQEFANSAVPGTLVKVPFNRKRVLGVVMSRSEKSEFPGELRYIAEVVYQFPVIVPTVLELAAAVTRHYGGTRWDVFRFALPVFSKRNERRAQQRASKGIGHVMAKGDPRYPAAFWDAVRREPSDTHRVRAFWNAPPAEDPFVFLTTLITNIQGSTLVLLPDLADIERLGRMLNESGILDQQNVLLWHSQLSRSEREDVFLQILHGRSLIVLGVRGAVFLPIQDLDLIILWDEGSETYLEQRAPYFHAREVAIMRSHIEKTHLIFGAAAPSLQSAMYIKKRYLGQLSPARETIKNQMITVQAIDQPNAPEEQGRISSRAWKVIKSGIAMGPVLVQVPMRGYVQSLSCRNCRNKALCSCGGKLYLPAKERQPECSLCRNIFYSWICQYCSSNQLYLAQIGDIKVLEELGRAFPNQAIFSSNADHRINCIPNKPLLVIATPGAEPIAAEGYSAAVVLNSALLLDRASLDAEVVARRRWFALATLIKPQGTLFIDADLRNRNIQALLRWDAFGVSMKEIEERESLSLPPTVRSLEITGTEGSVHMLLAGLPNSVIYTQTTHTNSGETQILLRIPEHLGVDVVADVISKARSQSARGMSVARVKIDPISL